MNDCTLLFSMNQRTEENFLYVTLNGLLF